MKSKKSILMMLVILSSMIETTPAHQKVHHCCNKRIKRQVTTLPPPWDANLVLGAVEELHGVNITNNRDISQRITSHAPANSSMVGASPQSIDISKTSFLLSMLPSHLANRGKASPMNQITTETIANASTKETFVLGMDPLVKLVDGKGNIISPGNVEKKEVTSDIATNNSHESIILNKTEQDSLNLGFTVDVNSPDWLTDDSAILDVFGIGMEIDPPIIDLTGSEDVMSAVDTLNIDDVTNKGTNDANQHVPNIDIESASNTKTTLKPVIPAKCNEKCLVKQKANTLKKIQQLDLKLENLVCLRNGQQQGCWRNQTVNNTNQTSLQTHVAEKKKKIFDSKIKILEKRRQILQTRLHGINNSIKEVNNKHANSGKQARKQRPSKVALKGNVKTPHRKTK